MTQASYYLANTGSSIGNQTQTYSKLYRLTFPGIIKKIDNITYCMLG